MACVGQTETDAAGHPVAPEARRWIVANLDCELDFPAAYFRDPDLRHRRNLSRAARETLDRLAPLLQPLGVDSDRVLPSGKGLTPADLRSSSAILAWAETPAVARLRQRLPSPSTEALRGPLPDLPLRQLLWKMPIASAVSAARANHRGFLFAAATGLGVALPGAAMIDSVEALERAMVRAHGRAQTPTAWVLKAPFSAAGRDRFQLPADRGPTRGELGRLEGYLARYRSVLLEPWMDRVMDFGCCAIVANGDIHVSSLHRQIVSEPGAFRGLLLECDPLACPGLQSDERESLLATVERVGERLLAVGYRGPFGVDAWRYRDVDGALRFHPLGEINARLTFGFVGRCWYDKLVEDKELPGGSGAALHLDRLPLPTPAGAVTLGERGWIEPRPT